MIELTDEFFQNPHDTYRILRARGPIHKVRIPGAGVTGWLVVDYGLARRLLSHASVRKDFHAPMGRVAVAANYVDDLTSTPIATSMLFRDPPDHTRLRRLVNSAFNSRVVDNLRPRVEEIADSLLDAVDETTTIDLLDSYAFPLPIMVICELLGVPAEDRTDFRRWSDATVNVGNPAERVAAGTQFTQYLTALVEARKAEPQADLLSELIAATDNGDQLSRSELVAMCVLLIVAGHETTTSLIGNAVLALLTRDSDLSTWLRETPDLIANFVEEVLRYDGPVHVATLRYATEPITIGTARIEPGDFIIASLAAANRDPGQFFLPEQFDPTRQTGHLAFGHGIHFCVGAPLARMEATIALARLLDRFPHVALDSPTTLQWRQSLIVRGLTRLPVRLQPATTEGNHQ